MILVLIISALENAIDRYRVNNAIPANVDVVSEDDLNVECEKLGQKMMLKNEYVVYWCRLCVSNLVIELTVATVF